VTKSPISITKQLQINYITPADHNQFKYFNESQTKSTLKQMSWLWGSSTESPAPTDTKTTLGALGLSTASSVAKDPRARKAATEFAEDEGVQEAASSFASDQRVQSAFLKSVGYPSKKSSPKEKGNANSTSNRTKRPSAAALAAAAAFQDSEEHQIQNKSSSISTPPNSNKTKTYQPSSSSSSRKSLSSFKNQKVKQSEPELKIPLYMQDPLPNSNVPDSFRQQFHLYSYVGREEDVTLIQQTKRKPLVDLMQRLYEAHHLEGTKKIGFEKEQQKESLHLEHLLQQYMLVPEPNRNITYCNDEDGNGENTNGNYLQSELAMLMMKRIELQCQEDRNKKGWS
jgi:hypothetical protein